MDEVGEAVVVLPLLREDGPGLQLNEEEVLQALSPEVGLERVGVQHAEGGQGPGPELRAAGCTA